MADSDTPSDADDQHVGPEPTHGHGGVHSDYHEEDIARLQFSQLPPMGELEKEKNVDRFDDVPLLVSIELGRINMPIRGILDLKEGSVVETRKLSGQPMEILVNNRLIGRGEVVVVGDNLAIRITDLLKPDLT